jgi:hypothetical protein
MHFWNYVLAIDENGRIFRSAQGHMQDRALLGYVDLLPAEHRVDAGSQTGFLGELKKEPEAFIDNPVLGVIEMQAHGVERQTLTPPGIICKKLSQV